MRIKHEQAVKANDSNAMDKYRRMILVAKYAQNYLPTATFDDFGGNTKKHGSTRVVDGDYHISVNINDRAYATEIIMHEASHIVSEENIRRSKQSKEKHIRDSNNITSEMQAFKSGNEMYIFIQKSFPSHIQGFLETMRYAIDKSDAALKSEIESRYSNSRSH